jgi:stage V sporulation protein AC
LYENAFSLSGDELAGAVSVTLIFLGTLLTGLGVYDRIGKNAGAGSIVPITGFANSVASPAMEFKTEGMVYGMAAKMFVVAGPIIVYGVLSGAIVGLIYLFL